MGGTEAEMKKKILEGSEHKATAIEDAIWDHAYEEGRKAGYKAGYEDGKRCAMMDAIYGKDEEEQ